jgi:hypothetical protein
MYVQPKTKAMFKTLLRSLHAGMKQIDACETIEDKKKKAVEIGFLRNLNRMKTIDEPAYEEYLNKHKETIKQS